MILAREASGEQMKVDVTQTETVQNNSIDAKLEAEQKKREMIWRANRAVKRMKTAEAHSPSTATSPTEASPRKTEGITVSTQTPRSTENNVAKQMTQVTSKSSEVDEVSRLKLQLAEKNQACDMLTKVIFYIHMSLEQCPRGKS